MEVEMSAVQVQHEIKRLHNQGESLAKKKVKKSNPQLMRSALHYYPNWDNAIEQSGISEAL